MRRRLESNLGWRWL